MCCQNNRRALHAQDPLQLDLFMNLTPLPPCGRRGCPRQGTLEHGCAVCGCNAPTIFDGYMNAIQKFLRR
jgi:hypothetical protein